MATDQERRAVLMALSDIITDALLGYMRDCEQPDLVYHSIPGALVGLAGSHIATMLRSGMIADGVSDKALDLLSESMRQHADPNAVELTPGLQQVRDILRNSKTGQ